MPTRRIHFGVWELGESIAIAAAPAATYGSYAVHVHTDDAGASIEAGLLAVQFSRIVVSLLNSGCPPDCRRAAGRGNGRCWPLATVLPELFAGAGVCVLQLGPYAVDPAGRYQCPPAVRAVVDTAPLR